MICHWQWASFVNRDWTIPKDVSLTSVLSWQLLRRASTHTFTPPGGARGLVWSSMHSCAHAYDCTICTLRSSVHACRMVPQLRPRATAAGCTCIARNNNYYGSVLYASRETQTHAFCRDMSSKKQANPPIDAAFGQKQYSTLQSAV